MKEDTIKELEDFMKMRLPAGWKMLKLEALFERDAPGWPEKYASVVLDTMNKAFYVKTNKSIVYEGEAEIMEEAIGIMRKSNEILKKKKI